MLVYYLERCSLKEISTSIEQHSTLMYTVLGIVLIMFHPISCCVAIVRKSKILFELQKKISKVLYNQLILNQALFMTYTLIYLFEYC